MYRITWTDRNGTAKNLQVHTMRACREVVESLNRDLHNNQITFTYLAPRRFREIVITVER